MEIKNMFDYIDTIHDKFPLVPKEDIKKILSFGLKSIYLHNMYGADTIIQDKAKNKYLFYIGRLTYDSLKHFYYYIKKMTIKIRILYNKRKIKWDGYYYFGLNEEQYNNYLSQQRGRGRKRKWFNFGTVMLYKILDECKINEHNKEYFFRVPYIVDLGYKILKNDYVTDKAEYLFYRKNEGFKSLNK